MFDTFFIYLVYNISLPAYFYDTKSYTKNIVVAFFITQNSQSHIL